MENLTRYCIIKDQIKRLENQLDAVKDSALSELVESGGKVETDAFKASLVTKQIFSASVATACLQAKLAQLEATIAEQKQLLQAQLKLSEAADKKDQTLLVSTVVSMRVDLPK